MGIQIQDYIVINQKILDYDPGWGGFRLAGKFVYFDNLIFKFKSDKFPESYWIIMLPTLSKGTLEVKATRYPEPSPALQPVEPPKYLTVSFVVRNGRLENHSIQNPHPGWGTFKVANYKMPILFANNSFYPGCEWQGRLPMQDGSGEFYLVLQPKSCAEIEIEIDRR